jgi:hypothetical protein
MKKRDKLHALTLALPFLIIFGTLAVSGIAFSEVSLNGSIETENGLILKTSQLQNNMNTLGIKLEYGGDTYHLFANPELQVSALGTVSTISELQGVDSIAPYTISLKEAYLDIYEFILPALDVRIGKQIVVWGTGDRINPTSNFCPADLSDLFDWGEKLGVTAFLMNLYIGDLIVTGIYSPVFTPTLLPINFQQMAGADLGTNTLELPGRALGETQAVAVRVNWPLFTFDFSASYYYGRYTIPVVYEVWVQADQSIESTKSNFPRLHVVGADFSGSLFDLGVWGELGVFIPEPYSSKMYYNHPIDGWILTEDVASAPYVRYVLGTDYTFKNGLYVNFQFAHGFDHEIGSDQVNDYFITRVEKSFFDDRLKIMPFTVIFTVSEWGDIANNYGLGWIPEVQFFPSDNLELSIGCYLLHGSGDNLFNNLKDDDALFFRAKVSF